MVLQSSFWHSVWFKRFAGLLAILFVFWVGSTLKDGASSPSGYESYDYAYEEEYYAEGVIYDDLTTATESSLAPSSYDYRGTSSSEEYQDSTETRVIKTASLTIDVKNTDEVMNSITSIATAYGGFVQSSETWLQSDETTAGYVTFRIESSYFEQALLDLEGLATVVRSQSVSGQDVTEEYVDLVSRLGNLEAEEVQYLAILSYATTVEELLNVSDYLADVREDIEVIKGRLNYLDDRTDFSTISVWIYEEASVILPTSDWQPVVVVKEAFNKLVEVLQGLVESFIWLVMFGVPIFIVFWIGRVVVHWRVRRRRN